MARATHVFSDDGLAVSALDNVTILVFARESSRMRLRTIRRHCEAHAARHGDRTAAITVVEPAAMSAPDEVREESANLTRDYPCVATATVLEGSGFKVVAARAVMTGIFLLARKTGNKLFSTVPEATEWVSRTMAGAQLRVSSAADLAAAVEETRRAIKR